MNNSRKRALLVIIGTLFVVSFFMPAYGDMPSPFNGWQCVCLSASFSLDGWDLVKLPGSLYYFGFVIANGLFVGMLALALRRLEVSRLRNILASVSLLYVLSWWIVNRAGAMGTGEDSFLICSGYYAWAAAFAGLAAAHFSFLRTPKAA